MRMIGMLAALLLDGRQPGVAGPGLAALWLSGAFRGVAGDAQHHTVAAAASPFLKAGMLEHDPMPSLHYYKTRFHLRDPAQPSLLDMTCLWDPMAPGNRPFMHHLTLDGIRAAVGDWMILIPPKETL